MPVPIKAIPDHGDQGRASLDYSFLENYVEQIPKKKNKFVAASNNDAKLLFDIWAKGEKQDKPDTFKVDPDISSKDILRLKTYGLLTGGTEVVKLTTKGKMIVSTMALAEPNRFEKKRQEKPYNEILADMNKSGKPGYRTPKYAANTSNNMDLRKT
jgi:hypothetical protein